MTLCCLPGEPFLATAERLAARIPGTVIATGYCDGVAGYLPPEDEYAAGGYEVAEAHLYYAMPGPFARGSAELVERAVLTLVDRLAAGG